MIYNYPYFGFPNYTKYMAQTYPYNYYNNNFNRPNNSVYNNQFNNNSNNLQGSTFNQNSNSYNGRINKSNNAPFRNNQPNKKRNNKQLYNNKNSPKSPSNIKTFPSSNTDSAPLFNLFGIQLYFDDILLICIILFLYNEKIEDNYLLIALVLLLLS